MLNPTEEEFEAWQDHPITRWVFDGCRIASEAAKATFIESAWETGKVDEKTLTELRTRADCYQGLADASLNDWASWHNPPEEE